MADETLRGFLATFLFSSRLHQDVRFYRQSSEPFKHRLAHVLLRLIVTHEDSRERTFNWSGKAGRIAAIGLANAYWSEEEPGIRRTFSRVAIGNPYSIIDDLWDEFGPDLERNLFKKKKPPEKWL